MKFIISQNGKICLPIKNISAINIEKDNDIYKLYVINMPLLNYSDKHCFGVFKTESRAIEALHAIFDELEEYCCTTVLDDVGANERQYWNNHEVACLLAELFGDTCACNFNNIDEWLSLKCDFAENICPNPSGVACWEQFLKYKGSEVQAE